MKLPQKQQVYFSSSPHRANDAFADQEVWQDLDVPSGAYEVSVDFGFWFGAAELPWRSISAEQHHRFRGANSSSERGKASLESESKDRAGKGSVLQNILCASLIPWPLYSSHFLPKCSMIPLARREWIINIITDG